MADQAQKKKRPSRRAYLNDFQQGADGQYVYTGRMLAYAGASYRGYRTRTALGAFGMLAGTLAGEMLPAVEAGRFPLCAILWLGQMVCVCLAVYAVFRILTGGNPMREYVHKASVDKVSMRALIGLIFSFLNASALVVLILVKGTGGQAAASWLRPALAAVSGVSAWLLYDTDRKAVWQIR